MVFIAAGVQQGWLLFFFKVAAQELFTKFNFNSRKIKFGRNGRISTPA